MHADPTPAPPLSATDRDFFERLVREHEQLAHAGHLNAAELLAARELLGFAPVLREIVANHQFQQTLWTRVGTARAKLQAILTLLVAIGGVATLAVTASNFFKG